MRTLLKPGVLIAVLVMLAGCTTPSPTSDSMTEAEARNLISEILSDVESIYLRETKTSEVVSAGFNQVQATYPGIEFAIHDGIFVASVGNETVASFKAGSENGASDYWGDRVADMLVQMGQVHSDKGDPTLKKLTDSFLQGVANGLDDSAAYIPPEWVEGGKSAPGKGEGGLDLILVRKPVGWLITRVRSPALYESDLVRKGDVLLAIDGTPLKGLSDIETLALLHGKIGSTIELTISRAGHDRPLTIELQREPPGRAAGDNYPFGGAFVIGAILIDPGTVKSMRQAMAEHATAPDVSVSGIILDLRGTVGGALEPVVDLADTFLETGPIFSTRGRHKESEQHFSATEKRPFRLPVVVLVDSYTGAGGELVAAALQDHGHAVVVGTTSFGKGTIETVLPLSNRGVLKLPWTEVITSSGYRLDKRGVMPTVCTGGSLAAEDVMAELRSGGGVTGYATRTQEIDPDDTAAVDDFRALCPPRSDGADIEIEVARALLANHALFSQVLAAASR